MAIKENENNFCEVTGIVEVPPTFSHEIYGEKFYSFTVSSERLSKSSDLINVTISEKLLPENDDLEIGRKVHIKGQYRSYNNFSGIGSKLILTLFVKDIDLVSDEYYTPCNYIELEGYLCKEPIYRVTPFGREITDLLVAVNRIHNKSDYIPCIVWGRNAKYASGLSVGDKIKLVGRIQSREYEKKYSENDIVKKTAYEISISKISKSETMI